jgi:hypothetical protein
VCFWFVRRSAQTNEEYESRRKGLNRNLHHDVGRALGDAEDVAVGALELALSTLGAGVKGYEVELLVFVALDEILPGCFEHHKVEIVAGGLLPLGSQRGLEQHTFVRLARRVCRAVFLDHHLQHSKHASAAKKSKRRREAEKKGSRYPVACESSLAKAEHVHARHFLDGSEARHNYGSAL